MKPSRFIESGVSSVVYSNVFVALCTTAFTAKSSLLLFGNNGSMHIDSTVFSATLLIYCFHRINKTKFLILHENREDRNSWMSAHKTVYYVLIALAVIILSVQAFYLPIRTWLVSVPVAIVGIGYTFPIIPTKNGWKRLRDIYWLKTFWIAFAFSCLTTFLPVLYAAPGASILQPEVLFIFARSLLFIFAICIPFDIRDMRFDKLKGVMTLPVKLGVNISISIAIILLFLFILLMGVDFLYFKLNLRMAFALFLSAILTIILLPLSKSNRYALKFPLLYDSALLVQWLFIWALMHY